MTEINKALASATYRKKNAQIEREIYEEMKVEPPHRTIYKDPNDDRPLPITLKKNQQQPEKEKKKV